MLVNNHILYGYEDTKLVKYDELNLDFPNTYFFDDLSNKQVSGVLKANWRYKGKLLQTYSTLENHTLTIAATRLGKTSSCVIPTIASFAKQKVKRSVVVSDPKGENYKMLASYLKDFGYDVILLNLRDYMHSEYWNPLLDIFRKYRKAMEIDKEVEVVQTEEGARNKFKGRIYQDQNMLDEAIEQMRTFLMADVDEQIDSLAFSLIPPDEAKDQYWNEAPRQLIKALLWAMLEDSDPQKDRTLIDENTFSFNTMYTIMDSLTPSNGYDDGKFFSSRGAKSKAYNCAKVILENASTTRQCIISCFYAKTAAFRNGTVRLITSCNSFELERLVSGKPVALFITYPDEDKVYYQVISTFVQKAYKFLINYANNLPSGKLKVPFYFILDEFGNFPRIADFNTTISACGGRNIWFNLVLQSYAQLNAVYGKDTAEIIRDNLNVHVFLGSNNPATLKEFSEECGYVTRYSPTSALNGAKGEMEQYSVETVPLVPKSWLSKLEPGECIVTEANSGYVLFSKMERYFTCKEFENLTLSRDEDYVGALNPLDSKYTYVLAKDAKKENFAKFDFDF